MRILMVAPQPVFSPRGTPISILNRCRALTALGHEIDLVTYPMGDDVPVDGLRYLRAPRVPGIGTVKIGPSLAKLPLDAAVLLRTLVQCATRRYDVIHTNEEAGVFGWMLHRVGRMAHVYEMHSDLAVVMTNYGLHARHPLVRMVGWIERRIVRSADSVVVHFPDQLAVVARRAPGTPATLVSDLSIEEDPDPASVQRIRTELASDGAPLIVYAGTLEPYQGVPSLLDALAALQHPTARLVIVGGRPDQVAALRARAGALGVSPRVTLCGLRDPGEIPAYLRAASVLVSPRSRGNNAPLKLLSYMRSGTPMVVTDIRSHTQLVDSSVALVVPASADALAAGIDAVLNDPVAAGARAAGARQRFRERYTMEAFIESTAAAYAVLPQGSSPDGEAVGEAVRRIEEAA
jgi:glycosyltransferase involved in cell wall biosynthesis